MTESDDLGALTGLWQSMDDAQAVKVDESILKKRQQRQRVHFAIEMTVSVGGFLAGVAIALAGGVATGVAAMLFSITGGLSAWVSRRKNIAALGESVRDQLLLKETMLRADTRQSLAGVVVLVAALLFVAFVRHDSGKAGEFATDLFTLGMMALLVLGLVGTLLRLAVLRRRGRLLSEQYRDIYTEEND